MANPPQFTANPGGLPSTPQLTRPDDRGAFFMALEKRSGRLAELTKRVEDERKEELLANARATVQANPQLVDSMLADQSDEALRRTMRGAVEAGLISRNQDPYFRTALLESYGNAQRLTVRSNVLQRMRRREHLGTDTPEGDVQNVVPFATIWQEEIDKASKASVLQSPLAMRAFSAGIAQDRPALQSAAQDDIDEAELGRAVRNLGTSVMEKSTAAAVIGTDESFAELNASVDRLRTSNVPEWRRIAVDGLIASAQQMGLEQPSQAAQFLELALDKVQLGLAPLNDDTVNAVRIGEAIQRLEADADAKELDDVQKRNLRRESSKDRLINAAGKELRELHKEGGHSGLDIVNQTLAEVLPLIDAESPEDETYLVDQITNYVRSSVQDVSSDPVALNDFTGRIRLATTNDALDVLDTLVDTERNVTLNALDVAALKEEIRTKRDRIRAGEGLESNTAYTAAKARAASNRTVPGLSAAEQHEVDKELDAMLVDWSLRLEGLVVDGKVPEAQMRQEVAAFESAMNERRAAIMVEHEERRTKLYEMADTGAPHAQLVQEFGGKIAPELMRDALTTADQVVIRRNATLYSGEVQSELNRASTLLEASLTTVVSQTDPQTGEDVVVETSPKEALVATDQLRRDFMAHMQTFSGEMRWGTDTSTAQQAVQAEARRWLEERTASVLADVRKLVVEGQQSGDVQEALSQMAGVISAGQTADMLHQNKAFNYNYFIDAFGLKKNSAITGYHTGSTGLFTLERSRPEFLEYVLRTAEDVELPKRGAYLTAALAPAGEVTIDDVVAGKFTIPDKVKAKFTKGLRGKPLEVQMARVQRLTSAIDEVELDPKILPHMAVPWFKSAKEARAFTDDPRRTKFFNALGITNTQAQERWIEVHAARLERTRN